MPGFKSMTVPRAVLTLTLTLFAPIAGALAQAIPGIYGGVPAGDSSTITRAQLIGTTTGGSSVNLTVPLNGARNYVFYYDGSGFLPAGTYDIYYLNSGGTQVAHASGNPITYTGGSSQADPPNSPVYNGALGIQVTLLNATNGNRPLTGIVHLLDQNNNPVASLPLNALGFVDFYYTNSTNASFIPPGTYQLSYQKPAASGKYYYLDDTITYSPSTQSGQDYYVLNAAANDGTLSLSPQCLPDDPNCANP